MTRTLTTQSATRAVRAWKVYAGFTNEVTTVPRGVADLEEKINASDNPTDRWVDLMTSEHFPSWLNFKAPQGCNPSTARLVSPWRYTPLQQRSLTAPGNGVRRGIFFFYGRDDPTTRDYLAASDAVTVGRPIGPIRPDPNPELARHGSCHAPGYTIDEIYLSDYWIERGVAAAFRARYQVPVHPLNSDSP